MPLSVVQMERALCLILHCVTCFAGILANAVSYDYTSSIECLENPHKPQYDGGIIVNPELNDGLKGWSKFGDAKIQHRESGGNKFIVAHSRNQPHGSASQKLYLQKNHLYTFSAWLQVSQGSVTVTAVFKTAAGFKHAGSIIAESKCWSMLKGGFTAHASGPAELYFESNNTSVEIWIDSISLQPFTEKQWRSHQDQSTEKIRKSKVRIQAVDKQGNPLSNATISIQQKKLSFPFGCVLNKEILSNTAHQNWFTSRFTVTTFGNEMKWYSNEYSEGHEDYSLADAMLNFAKQHKIAVRGHNVFWDDPNYQPGWVKSISPRHLFKASYTRIKSVMSRYKGQLIAWDVVNENLHFDFFESKLGQNASAFYYHLAGQIDGTPLLFMNEFNTIEDSRDGSCTPAKYLQKLRDIQAYPGNNNLHMAIGLESHFSGPPDLAYVRSSIDKLAAANVPIWITELDVYNSPDQAKQLEQILREVHSHPKIAGIVLWAGYMWEPNGCNRMCLTDNNFNNLPTGDVVDTLLRGWGGLTALEGITDANGFYEASLFHGDYNVKISHPAGVINSFLTASPQVETTLLFQVTA